MLEPKLFNRVEICGINCTIISDFAIWRQKSVFDRENDLETTKNYKNMIK